MWVVNNDVNLFQIQKIKWAISVLQESLSRPVYLPKTATEQLKEIFEKQRQTNVSSLDEKQAE